MNVWSNDRIQYNSLPIISYKAIFPRINTKDKDKEIDLIIQDKREASQKYHLIEIKHSQKRHTNQTKWLQDEMVSKRLLRDEGEIISKTVLYNGETTITDQGIHYVNIEEYLQTVYTGGLTAALELLSNT